jgi:hypothetical protein
LTSGHLWRTACWLLVCDLFPATPTAAQERPRVDLGGAFEVGGEAERYVRALQVAGIVPATMWTIQPFAPSQAQLLRATAPHPWRERFDSARRASSTAPGVHWLCPSTRVIASSSFPFQVDHGPTWVGRGLTADAQAGVSAGWKIIYVQLAPLMYVSQNAGFPLAPNGFTNDERFADARFPGDIDAPQRFGPSAFVRLDAGNSEVSIDTRLVALGFSSAPQRWGPAHEYPLVLGPNAGGFPHVYAGTSKPLDLWLFQAHGRLVYGDLGQSAYTSSVGGLERRVAAGLVFAVTPRGLNGLELGATRFIHRPWPQHFTLELIERPLSATNIGATSNNVSFENQVASVFARWAVPAARAEVYGELYREDFPGRLHEAPSLVEKPDDLAAFTIGFQRVLTANERTMRVLRGELVNGETSHQERGERGFSSPIPPYVHGVVTQGHTLNGLILGSPEAYTGAGWRLVLDEFTPGGRRSVSLERFLRLDWLPTQPQSAPIHPDVLYAVRGEWVRFQRGRELGITVAPALDLNRNMVAGHDVFNLLVALSARRR